MNFLPSLNHCQMNHLVLRLVFHLLQCEQQYHHLTWEVLAQVRCNGSILGGEVQASSGACSSVKRLHGVVQAQCWLDCLPQARFLARRGTVTVQGMRPSVRNSLMSAFGSKRTSRCRRYRRCTEATRKASVVQSTIDPSTASGSFAPATLPRRSRSALPPECLPLKQHSTAR